MRDCIVVSNGSQVWSAVFPHAVLQLCRGLHAPIFLSVSLQNELKVRKKKHS